MSYALQRLMSYRFSKIRGLANLGGKALASQGSGSEGLSRILGRCGNENSRFHHTDHTSSVPSINLSAIFNSTKLNIIDPLVRNQNVIDPRVISDLDISDKPKTEKIIEEPDQPHIVEKHAHRMINLRRRKIKKHQRRKLRKRMQYEWATREKRRRNIKEKAFVAEMMAQIKTAQTFSPERYVAEQRRVINQVYLPLKYEQMPQWYREQVMANEKRLEREKKEDEERNKLLAEFSKTYKMTDGPS